ncbi:transposase [Pleionea mediterranea]|uniref:Transposase n=1 Tax=Pleionea mediterranea TaxID=523701 RepID=A0A316FKU1_9GAMM|nr:transposase [Pleionea mediterranea]PWK49324.1 transposase [Pleionea mediterranea]
MPKTYSKEYDRYSNNFKRLAVLLTYHPDLLALEVAEHLGIHPVMLYRWRMEMKRGQIKGGDSEADIVEETELIEANRRIKQLEKQLKETQRERDFLKKVKRFSQQKK